MNDLYKEILIKREKKPTDLLTKAGLIILIAVTAAAGLVLHPLFLILTILSGVLAWFVISGMDVEYEYLYVNGDFDIDKIFHKQRRKRIDSLEAASLVKLAPVSSHELDSYTAQTNAVRRDYSSGNEKNCYACVYQTEKETRIVKLELTREVLEDLRRRAPSKISRECF